MDQDQTSRNIYYTLIDADQREKPWLTMIHGFSHTHQYFSSQIPRFRQDYRIFLADLRGHGQSAEAAGPYGIEEYTDDILTALDVAGIEHTHYWGTHTGAAVGLVLALRCPDRFASLILEGTYLPGFEMPRVNELQDRARSIARSNGINAALEDWFGYADWFEFIRKNPEKCRSLEHKQMVFEFQGDPWLSQDTPREVTPVADLLKSIHLPVLLYNGEQDMLDFINAAAKLTEDLSQGQRAFIPNAGGFPGWENPKFVNDIVHQFLSALKI